METQTRATDAPVASTSTQGAMKSTLPHAATSSTTFSLNELAPIVAYLEDLPSVSSTVPVPASPTTTAVTKGGQGHGNQSLGSVDLFLHIGRCEQPGDGWQGIQWDHHGSYNGGLGILNANWRWIVRNLPHLPANAYDATPLQQIEGAQWLAWKVGGFNGWSCWTAHHKKWGY